MARRIARVSPRLRASKRQWDEAKHRRDARGRFADKPGAGDDAPRGPGRARRSVPIRAASPSSRASGGSRGSGGSKSLKDFSPGSPVFSLLTASSSDVLRGAPGSRFPESMTIDQYLSILERGYGLDRMSSLRRIANAIARGQMQHVPGGPPEPSRYGAMSRPAGGWTAEHIHVGPGVSDEFRDSFLRRLNSLPPRFVDAVMDRPPVLVVDHKTLPDVTRVYPFGGYPPSAFYSKQTNRTYFLESLLAKDARSLVRKNGATEQDLDDWHTSVVAHELGHAHDRRSSPQSTPESGDQYAVSHTDPEYLRLRKDAADDYRARMNPQSRSDAHDEYYVSKPEMWAAATEMVMFERNRVGASIGGSSLLKDVITKVDSGGVSVENFVRNWYAERGYL